MMMAPAVSSPRAQSSKPAHTGTDVEPTASDNKAVKQSKIPNNHGVEAFNRAIAATA